MQNISEAPANAQDAGTAFRSPARNEAQMTLAAAPTTVTPS
jgi:hypothetical protein